MTYSHNPELPLPQDIIAHRPPSLWLDGVTELEKGVRAQGFWTPDTLDHFEGHFPEIPVLKGFLSAEAMAQLGVYAFMTQLDQPSDFMPMLKGGQVECLSPILPGDTLEMEVEITDKLKREFTGQGTIKVNGRLAVEASVRGLIVPKLVAKRFLTRDASPSMQLASAPRLGR